ncbi:hypothetical protein [Moritella sp. F3]|uniref:hypothetical protein n=1 Tax=Moritella sp. F3 TaxID=2718882 RepID=UPI0018E133D4|nr:hypothetical protein [Moritella sp. F3]GIC77121.1 hypothetical protein FMO001_18480 [Moritella sp. F1]GIC82240.1 hypothetical protein FMO003_25210 [Moritella sp. F3]
MKFREAIEFVKTNKIMSSSVPSLIGVSYLPNDTDGEFQIVTISLNEDDYEDGEIWVDVSIEGGSIRSSCGTEGAYGGEDYESVIINLKNEPSDHSSTLIMLESLNFEFFDVVRTMEVFEYALFEIFPSLPEPNETWEFDSAEFKAQAIELINSLNKKH